MNVIPFPQPGARLGDLLASARGELAAAVPPPWVAARLEARLAARVDAPRPVSLAVVGAPADGLAQDFPDPAGQGGADGPAWLAVVFILLLLLAFAAGLRGTAPRQAESPVADLVGSSGFESVVRPQRWLPAGSQAGAERAWLVTAEMPAQQLATFGLPFDPARAGEAVRAELLLDPGGEILAVRLPR